MLSVRGRGAVTVDTCSASAPRPGISAARGMPPPPLVSCENKAFVVDSSTPLRGLTGTETQAADIPAAPGCGVMSGRDPGSPGVNGILPVLSIKLCGFI